MVGRLHSRSCTLVLALLSGCGTTASAERDPADYLAVGVDPSSEAASLRDSLAVDGYRVVREADGAGWAAFAMTRADGASVARLVSRRGVVVALDETPSAMGPARGLLDIGADPALPSDVDGDGAADVVLARVERDRRCLLIVTLDDDGGAQPLVVDTANLAPDLCLEDLRDVDGNERPEAIVRVRARALARATIPTADLPLERDSDGVYRRVDPASRFVADERARRDLLLSRARAAPDPEAAYAAAVEIALVSFVAGESPDVQVEAFDAAMTGVVLDLDLVTAVHFARGEIAAGRVTR